MPDLPQPASARQARFPLPAPACRGMITPMGTVLSILGFISKFGSALMDWWHDRSVKDAQKTADERDQAVAGLGELQTAQKARDDAAGALSADPGRVRQPDANAAARGRDGIS